MRVAGDERWIAAEDAGRYRDALGVTLPVGVAAAFLESGMDPLAALLVRFARRRGPFLADAPAGRWGLPVGAVEPALELLLAAGTLVRGEFRPGGTEREWCDPEVLRMLRRRSLARLRREVEPVEPAALARFLTGWHGIGGSAGGTSRLAEVVAQLEGLPLPASVLEREILPARVRDYAPRLLDELGAAGEVLWVGQGSLGQDDGRVALYRPDRLALLLPPATQPADAGWLADLIVGHLEARGASFYRDLLAAALRGATAAGRRAPDARELLDALWQLVWAGRVTNDTFAPLRALRWKRRDRPAGRPRPGTLRMGPPEAVGRWSLVSEAVATAVALGGDPPSDTTRRHALANLLLDRQGVVTRDGVAAEGTSGGFGAVYPMLRELEDRGRVRRGYFVEGLGGAQFALPGVVDRLRAARGEPSAGADGAGDHGDRRAGGDGPGQPLRRGAAVAGDRRRRDAGPGGRGPHRPARRPAGPLPGARRPVASHAPRRGAARRVRGWRPGVWPRSSAEGRLRSLEIARVDGLPPGDSAWRGRLEGAGWRAAYRGWVPAAGLATAGARYHRADV